MHHPEFPVASFLCLPLLLCSLPSHVRAGSVSTIALIAWLGVMSLIRGVNALVWADNVAVKLEVWCDITTKITIGFTYAVPAAALCILRHLESVASTRNARSTTADKRRRQKFEAVMCFGVPILFMALHYIVQGHRFDLIEDLGCSPAQYISVAAIFILWIPPLLISLVTTVYAALSLRHFLRHRISFATHLRNSQSSISPARYFRLMALAIVEMAWDAGTNIYLLYFNISVSGLRPWISWGNVHSDFSRIAVFPTFVFPPWLLNQFILQWWIIPISCVFFFIFFGFGEEAMADYHSIVLWARRTILRQNTQNKGSYGDSSLPTYFSSHHHGIGVALPPPFPVDASEHEHKPWDNLSIKMLMSHQRADVPPATPATHNVSSIIPVSHRRASSSSMPTLTITYPDEELRYAEDNLGTELSSVAGMNFVPLRHLPCEPPSRPSSCRRSMSTDLNITVSQAFLPNMNTASRYPEEALLTPTESAGTAPPQPEPTHYTHLEEFS